MTAVSLEVTPPHAPGTIWRLSADLYLPPGEPPRTVQLLLPGLTYDRRYWTAPGTAGYVRHAVAEGYAVLALDRPGTGASEHPPADECSVEANVEAVHQVIRTLRTGTAEIPAFSYVVAVGHSLGSGIALLDAARHHDLDALVLTSLVHAFGPLYPEAAPALHPASGDPVLGPTAFPENYLTTKPGLRSRLYEHEGGVDPELSAYHEETKSTVPLGEGLTMDAIYQPGPAAEVDVPVLLVAGQYDRLFGGGDLSTEQAGEVVAYEGKFYTAVPGLEAYVLPDAAHSLNVHRTAPRWYAAAHEWLARRLPQAAPRRAVGN
ncbi:alpha/beta fold hydrolase [Streptomyces sp. N2-109]|uniref:Alpha/beta fold hydrolase n=1 Tax=Streptomyces gossypii TaxID=2883101 RepID=A0ABT2K391_9ACTN|nr:alpha/beta fold hydrolase [Streptomyces gossypii]MCT2594637.1 alpha/beta fold hydrolase [Streptomyces gossypii]